MNWISQNFFSYILITSLLLVTAISYVRFIVLNDYAVAYEGDCDPYAASCFVGCEDDECNEEYYYFLIQKYAQHIEMQCGPDITDCVTAYECLPEDGDRCEVTYCDPSVDGEDACETLTEEDVEIEENLEEEENISKEEEGVEEADDETEEVEADEGEPLTDDRVTEEEL